MLKAVLWDFGGVLTTSPFEAFNRYERENNLPLDFIRTVNATNPDDNAWAQFERSDITPAVFDQRFAEESASLGHRIQGAAVLSLLSGDVRPNMLAALRAIKQTYRVACITNNVRSGQGAGMATTSERANRVAEVMSEFDLVVESSELGIRKPDPRIYQHTCDALGIEANEALFIDDLGINLKPARALGMQTIKVLSEQQALDELSMALSIELEGSSGR